MKDKAAVEKYIKSLTDACFCYVEFFPHNNESYQQFKSLIMPSEQETFARIKYSENGQSEKLTINSGVGKGERDLVDEEKAPVDAYASGKSTYSTVSSHQRLELLVNKFDQAKKLRDELLSQQSIKALDDNDQVPLQKAEKAYEDLLSIMEKYRVPLEAADRKPLQEYIRPSFIENLAASSELPLIATSSGTEGRALVTLYDLNAFGKNEEFDPSKALLITNCIFSVLQYGGHHSYVELVEPYNRLLDAVCIACENKKEQLQDCQIPLVKAGNREHLINFIHESIRDDVAIKMEELIKAKSTNEKEEQAKNIAAKPVSISGEQTVVQAQKIHLSATSNMPTPPQRGEIFKEDNIIDLAKKKDTTENQSSSSSSGSHLQKMKDPNENTSTGSEQNATSSDSSKQFKM